MFPYITSLFGNPHSQTYPTGLLPAKAVERARKQISDAIHAKPSDIIFTSGATESNNMAIKGLVMTNPTRKHIVTTKIEHKIVLVCCEELEKQGYDITYLDVESNGLINIEKLKSVLREDTLLCSFIFVNNEVGVAQPLKEIGELCR